MELLNEKLVVQIIGGAIILFVFIKIFFISDSKDKNKKIKPLTKEDIDKLFSEHKEVVQLANHIDVINQTYHDRRHQVDDLEDEIYQLSQELAREKQRLEFLKNSPELKSLEDVKEEISKLEQIKKTFKQINQTQMKRFSVVILVNVVKELYKELYNIDLSTKEVEDMINAYSDSDSTESSSGGGKSNLSKIQQRISGDKKPNNPNRNMR
jgi:predicted  nucleic acid-binding Zn-ribbon protein